MTLPLSFSEFLSQAILSELERSPSCLVIASSISFVRFMCFTFIFFIRLRRDSSLEGVQ